jgi:WD40 repeat protein
MNPQAQRLTRHVAPHGLRRFRSIRNHERPLCVRNARSSIAATLTLCPLLRSFSVRSWCRNAADSGAGAATEREVRSFVGLHATCGPRNTVVAATCADGTVPLWSVQGTSVERIDTIPSSALGSRATSVAWMSGGLSIVVGCTDGSASKWDLRNTQVSR